MIINKFLDMLASSPVLSAFLRRSVQLNLRNQKSIIKNHFICSKDDKILDLGCGTGEFSPYFPADQYTGIDIDSKNIAYASKKYKGKFLLGDATSLPFPDNTFTKILVLGVFHHLSDQDAETAIKEMKRILRKEGKVLIAEDAKSSAFLTKKMQSIDQGRFIRTAGEWENFFKSRFTVEKKWIFKEGISLYAAFILKNDI